MATVSGGIRFEVAEEKCIGCGLCEERAPENIQILPGEVTARVVKQPMDDGEMQACQQAMDYCPMGGLHAVCPEPTAACVTECIAKEERRKS